MFTYSCFRTILSFEEMQTYLFMKNWTTGPFYILLGKKTSCGKKIAKLNEQIFANLCWNKGTRCLSPEINSSNNVWQKRKNLFKVLILLYGQAASKQSIFRNIVGCYQNRNPSQTFSGDNIISSFEKIVSGGTTFQLKHRTMVYRPELY